MEVGKMSSLVSATKYKNDDGDDVPLPGFRFHPTDEELVGFYLPRKIEKKTLRIQQLIKQVDIYKYDPWDLPMNMHSEGGNTGDKEGYFFCKRGRKYKNSVRPNRVTGSGFWKATGIDKPIYSTTGGSREGGGSRDCIGLKKSLVYYRGSAGKGTKTDWMMHEFRLPTDHDLDHKSTKLHIRVINVADQDAEVWTLCRILKRKASHGKYVPNWREMSSKRNPSDESFETYSSVEVADRHANYNNIGTLENHRNEKKQLVNDHVGKTNQMLSNSIISQAPSSSLSLFSPQVNEFIKYGDWDELRSVVEFAFDPLFW